MIKKQKTISKILIEIKYFYLKKQSKALTLIEVLIAMAIIGTLAGIGVPIYNDYMEDQRVGVAKADIARLQSEIIKFMVERGRPPDNFAEAGLGTPKDPWGRDYRYLRIAGLDITQWDGKCRKDRNTKPLNSDFDLYSVGADGATVQTLTATASWDDIVRAGNGTFIGLGSDY